MPVRIPKSRKAIQITLAVILLLSIAGAAGFRIFWHSPTLLPAKRWAKRTMKIAAFRDAYAIPNARMPGPDVRVQEPPLENIRLTDRERIAELLIGRFPDTAFAPVGGLESSPGTSRRWVPFGKYRPYDPAGTASWANHVVTRAASSRIRLLLYDEGEGGYVLRIGTMPSAGDIGDYYREGIIGETLRGLLPIADPTTRLARVDSIFAAHADVLAKAGIDVVLSPVLDVPTTPDINSYVVADERSFSPDYGEVLELARRYIDAMHDVGIRCIAKHYPNIGALAEINLHAGSTMHPQNELWEAQTLRLYTQLADKLDGIMLAHSGNPRDGGKPFSVSPVAVRFLRDSLGFDGLITTDAVDMRPLFDYVTGDALDAREQFLVAGATRPVAAATVLAFEAGVTTVLLGERGTRDLDETISAVTDAYRRDETFRQKIESALLVYERFAN